MVVIDTSASMAEPYPITGACVRMSSFAPGLGWLCCAPPKPLLNRTFPNTHTHTCTIHTHTHSPTHTHVHYTHARTHALTHARTGLAAEEGPPPSKLDVAKELATLMLADRAVAEQVGLRSSHTSQPDLPGALLA